MSSRNRHCFGASLIALIPAVTSLETYGFDADAVSQVSEGIAGMALMNTDGTESVAVPEHKQKLLGPTGPRVSERTLLVGDERHNHASAFDGISSAYPLTLESASDIAGVSHSMDVAAHVVIMENNLDTAGDLAIELVGAPLPGPAVMRAAMDMVTIGRFATGQAPIRSLEDIPVIQSQVWAAKALNQPIWGPPSIPGLYTYSDNARNVSMGVGKSTLLQGTMINQQMNITIHESFSGADFNSWYSHIGSPR